MDLFICNTPFHIYMVRKIRESQGGGDFKVCYFGEKTEKSIFYCNDINNVADEVIWIDLNKKFPFYLLTIIKNFIFKRFDNVFLASIDSIYSQYILSYIRFSNLATFDDGSANVNLTSSYYTTKKKKKDFLHSFFFKTISKEDILSISKTHYTVYKFKNIIDRTVYLDRYSNFNNREVRNLNRKCSIVLGSVYREIAPGNCEELVFRINRFIKKLSLEEKSLLYLPHPRDDSVVVSDMRNINTNLIFEDLVCSLLDKFDSIEIYNFASSCTIGLESDKIRVIYFESELLSDSYTQTLHSIISNFSLSPQTIKI